MADLFPSLFLILAPSLGTSSSIASGLRSWITSARYSVDPNSTENAIKITNFDTNEFVQYFAYDWERFALSSYESFKLHKLELVDANLPAWPTLKLYYGAFFAAHAITRAVGTSVTSLDSRQAQLLSDFLALTTNTAKPVEPGSFEVAFRNGELLLQKHKVGSGVHASFWSFFNRVLNGKAEEAATNKSAGSGDFVAGSIEVTGAIGQGGNGVWIFSLRNDINYRHQHNLWFPVARTNDSRKHLRRITMSSSKSISLPTGSKKCFEDFVNICLYLISLNYELSEAISVRNKSGRAFGAKWNRLVNL